MLGQPHPQPPPGPNSFREGVWRFVSDAITQGGVILREIGEHVLRELAEQEALNDKWSRKAFGPLLDELGWRSHQRLVALLDEGDHGGVDALLESALTGDAFQHELRELLADVPLTDANHEQLVDGLDALIRGRFASAGALLILAVEGTLWHEAVRRQIIERGTTGKARNKMRLVASDGSAPNTIGGVEDLFTPLQLGPSTTAFLNYHVYGGSGHKYRHGNAEDDWKRRSLMLVVTVVIVLQRMMGIEEQTEPPPVYANDIANLLLRAFSVGDDVASTGSV